MKRPPEANEIAYRHGRFMQEVLDCNPRLIVSSPYKGHLLLLRLKSKPPCRSVCRFIHLRKCADANNLLWLAMNRRSQTRT